jgi:hypothetical protein
MKERVYTILCRDQGVMLTYLQHYDKISRHTSAKKAGHARVLSKDRPKRQWDCSSEFDVRMLRQGGAAGVGGREQDARID